MINYSIRIITLSGYTMTESYQYLVEHLRSSFAHWHLQRLRCLAQCVLAMIQERSVTLDTLATSFAGSAQQASSTQRLRRFLIECGYAARDVAVFLLGLLPTEPWTLTLDRTEWKFGKTPLNILVIGVLVGDISVPLVWSLLPKAGASDTAERIALFDRLFTLVSPERIGSVVADREFIGSEFFGFFLKAGIRFRIRIRKNFLAPRRDGKFVPVYRFFQALEPQQPARVFRPLPIGGQTLWITGMKLKGGDYLIVVSADRTAAALEDYARRWSIELLFGCLKSRGFNCEDTHLTDPERIEVLMAALALAFFWAHRVGVWKNDREPLTVKKHGRKEKSVFRYGLDELKTIIHNFTARKNDFIRLLRLLYGT